MQTLASGKILSILQLFWTTVTDSRTIQSLLKYWSGCGMEFSQEKIAIKSIKGYLDQKFRCQMLMSMQTFHNYCTQEIGEREILSKLYIFLQKIILITFLVIISPQSDWIWQHPWLYPVPNNKIFYYWWKKNLSG